MKISITSTTPTLQYLIPNKIVFHLYVQPRQQPVGLIRFVQLEHVLLPDRELDQARVAQLIQGPVVLRWRHRWRGEGGGEVGTGLVMGVMERYVNIS
jgi:hypothetical protein